MRAIIERLEQTWLGKQAMALFRKHEQFVKFLCIGASNAVISFLVNVIVLYLFDRNEIVFRTNMDGDAGMRWNEVIQTQISAVPAFLISSLNGYAWNKVWVFRGSDAKKSFLKFYASYGSTFVMGQLITLGFVAFLGINKYLVSIPVMAVMTLVNFALSKFWAFRKSGASASDEKS